MSLLQHLTESEMDIWAVGLQTPHSRSVQDDTNAKKKLKADFAQIRLLIIFQALEDFVFQNVSL